jgi:predicted Zn-dependent protease with MMP-like domain
LTVGEVDGFVNDFAMHAPEALIAVVQNVTVYVARDRYDGAVLKAAVQEAGQGPVAIPHNFRAVYIGEQLDDGAVADDDADAAVDSIRGVIVLNASMLRSAEDVFDTLLHEIGHALGFDEDEVAILGLE